jgi:type IV secretion system protein VirB8
VNQQAEYFDKAESWATDTQIVSLRSRRIGWTLAAVATGIAALEALALAMLAPLKTVQPITLLVDRQTGFVQAIDPDTPRRVSADDLLTQSFLAQYVTAREGFDRATLPVDYRKVALLSAGTARQSYLAEMPATNPASPFRRLPSGSVVAARIKSVSRLDPGTALVRFDTQQQSPGGGALLPQAWIATVRYAYSNAPMSLEDRLVNPLGFKVLSYRRNAEAPPPAQPLVPAAARPLGAATPVAVPVVPVVPVARVGNRVVEVDAVPSGSPLPNGGR